MFPAYSKTSRTTVSLATSILFHLGVVAVLLVVPSERSRLPPRAFPGSFVRLAQLRVPAIQSAARPSNHRKAPGASAIAEASSARRVFAAPPAVIPAAEIPPVRMTQPDAPQMAPAIEFLAPAPAPPRTNLPLPDPSTSVPLPVQTGQFSELQFAPLSPVRPNQPAVAGFEQVQLTTAAKSRYVIPSGAFSAATVSPGRPVPPAGMTNSGFAAAAVAQPITSPAPVDPGPARSYHPAEIQFKPVPEYTEEGRRQRIEGEVLLEILFTATGEARLVRLVRGLGHGLDQAAEVAARQIQFRPAQRAGAPVDSLALVHIEFHLAY